MEHWGENEGTLKEVIASKYEIKEYEMSYVDREGGSISARPKLWKDILKLWNKWNKVGKDFA